MERGTLLVLVVAVLTLLAVIFSHFALSSEIAEGAGGAPILQAAPAGLALIVQGVGTTTTWTNGAGNCTPGNATSALVSINGGAGGNQVTATAVCTFTNLATATATDPGNQANALARNNGNPGTGAASCVVTFPVMVAPDSHWTALCLF